MLLEMLLSEVSSLLAHGYFTLCTDRRKWAAWYPRKFLDVGCGARASMLRLLSLGLGSPQPLLGPSAVS